MKYKEANIPHYLKLKVYHRRPESDDVSTWTTEATLYTADNQLAGYGLAKCNPKDNPSRKVGRAIAVGRALKDARNRGWGMQS